MILPEGWQERADTALNEIREEINRAEIEAETAGANIATARKAVITAELKKENRRKIWKDLAPGLAQLRNDKCWYSESKNSGSDKDVDHFRPKNAVAEAPKHQGYWWLAFDWHNYRYSCQWCNQRRVDTINKTNGGKWDHFPICSDSCRANTEGEDIAIEDIDLLDPTDPHDWKLLTFRPDGRPIPAKPEDTREFWRAEVSIRLYHLDRKEFVDDRRILAGRIQRLIQDMERLLPKIDDLGIKQIYKNQGKDLLRLIDRDSEYSGAALAYARAEIYKMDRGHQVKRDWLEEILNLNL